MTQNPWGPASGHDGRSDSQHGWGSDAQQYNGAPPPQGWQHQQTGPQGPQRYPRPSEAVRPPQSQQSWNGQQGSRPSYGQQPPYGRQQSYGPQQGQPQQQPSYGQQPTTNAYAGRQQGYQGGGQPPYGTYSAPYQPRVTQQPGYGQQYPPQYRQQPYYPPQPTQQPWGYPPAPPSRSRTPWAAIIGTIAALVVLAIVAASFLIALSPRKTPTTPVTTPSHSATPAWVNDGYRVPDPDPNPDPILQPNSDDQAKQWMTDNAIYQQAVAIPVRCDVPDIDQLSASDEELEEHINAVVGCLVRSWYLPVTDAGFTLYRPTVTVYHDSISTKCGKAKGGNAFFCGSDQQIYYASDVAAALPDDMRGKRWTSESIVAHEFGHDIQGRTGILYSAHYAQTAPWGRDQKNEYNRRMELQADCFAGVFLQSISLSMHMSKEDIATIKTMFHEFGDDVQTGKANFDGDHGLGADREYWVDQGLHAKTLATCNTFTADSSQVR